VLAQATAAFAPHCWPRAPTLLHAASEKRATFQCVPALQRPAPQIGAGLWAAGDYVAGPYPATLEGAVLSGETAAHGLGALSS
jgi:predicted NAD/FAD-dependent oxidoreductase